MDYAEIIRDNCTHHSPVSWWPKFAYHDTDIENAVSILHSGFLYSRANAKQLGLMKNDNASRQVINMTKTDARSNVRLYFRPLTPTQYYNEGYKHPQLRYDNDENADMPVPIFFLFDLSKLLTVPGVQFSELPQSGYGSELKSGPESFAALPFDKIYSNGFEGFEENIKYRHAEILHPRSMQIDPSLSVVLCRNSLERTSLLNMLKEKDSKSFYKYKSIIKVCKEDMFENNGLFLTDCRYHENVISITFSDTYEKQQYIRRMMNKNQLTELNPVKVQLILDWMNSRNIVAHNETETQIDYQTASGLSFRDIPSVPNAKFLRIQLFIDQNPMCYVEQSVEEAELIK